MNRISPNEVSGQIAAGTGCSGAFNPYPIPYLVAYFRHSFSYCVERLARGRQVSPCHNVVLFINKNNIGTERTDVNAKIYVDFFIAVTLDHYIFISGRRGLFQLLKMAAVRLQIYEVFFKAVETAKCVNIYRFVVQNIVERPYCTHGRMIFRYCQLCFIQFENFSKSPDNTLICRHSALKYHRRCEFLSAGQTALEVSCHGKAKSGDNIFNRRGDLLQMNHVTFCEYAASAGNSRRIFTFHCQLPEFVFD